MLRNTKKIKNLPDSRAEKCNPTTPFDFHLKGRKMLKQRIQASRNDIQLTIKPTIEKIIENTFI